MQVMLSGTQPRLSSHMMNRTAALPSHRGSLLRMSISPVVLSTLSERHSVTCWRMYSWTVSMVSSPVVCSMARASAPLSENCFFTTKDAVTSLRWKKLPLTMKRFILGRRVMVFTSAVSTRWK